ncbi:hypothetical protein H5V45_21130 [Nocardioides sp. KIGAM211]|uniref:Uncharacterized protein n=1 Tax=Nocardioides luti TaxID=2761101 RepID=A0A7X0VCT5_9ACTN|nr:hypothetical protein [Nocardioides luti]MBB6629835.1 hypothetical protein [Nocardioides luti]
MAEPLSLDAALAVALVTADAGHPTVSGEAVMMVAGPSRGVAALDAVNEVLEFAHREGRKVVATEPDLGPAAAEVAARVARRWPELSPDVVRRVGNLWAYENR